MCKLIWDMEDGDYICKLSDNMAMNSDGDIMMRLSDNSAYDMESGEIHFVSSWSDDDEDNYY